MNVTMDVITDLLPLYAAGECSQDSRKLVEEGLRTHPELERQIKQISGKLSLPGVLPDLPPNAERRSLEKTRGILIRRSTLMGFAVFFSLVPFSCLHTGGRLYLLAVESPVSAVIYAGLGVACWIAYFAVKKRSGEI